jgi:acyl-CoA thioesterase FadM
LVCYDTETTQQTLQLDTPISSPILDFSAPFQIPGQFKIAILLKRYGTSNIHILILVCSNINYRPRSVVVVCVDHKDGKATSFRQIYRAELDTHTYYCRPFLYEDHVGMISYAHSDGNVMISAVSGKHGGRVVMPTNLPSVSTMAMLACVSLTSCLLRFRAPLIKSHRSPLEMPYTS